MLQDCAINCGHIQTVSKGCLGIDDDPFRRQDARGIQRRRFRFRAGAMSGT